MIVVVVSIKMTVKIMKEGKKMSIKVTIEEEGKETQVFEGLDMVAALLSTEVEDGVHHKRLITGQLTNHESISSVYAGITKVACDFMVAIMPTLEPMEQLMVLMDTKQKTTKLMEEGLPLLGPNDKSFAQVLRGTRRNHAQG